MDPMKGQKVVPRQIHLHFVRRSKMLPRYLLEQRQQKTRDGLFRWRYHCEGLSLLLVFPHQSSEKLLLQSHRKYKDLIRSTLQASNKNENIL